MIGSTGFYIIEGENWSIIDSIYMTIITISTVGFGEVHVLSQYGKIWAIIVIIFGISINGWGRIQHLSNSNKIVNVAIVQPNIEPNPGAFPVSMWYPNNYTARNSNASQKSDLTGKVFWNTQKCLGIFRIILEYSEIFRNIQNI